MKVITVTREYGAGGGEVARKLADALGWQLLDRELLQQAAAVEHVADAELERLDERAVAMADRFRLHPPHQKYLHGLTQAARQAAERGQVVLVGRGTRQFLGEMPDAFHLRLVAPRPWRTARMAGLEGWSAQQAQARCLEMDRTRELFTRYFFGPAALQPEQYDLVVNTGRVPLDDVVAVVSAMAGRAPAESGGQPAGRRVLTLSRQVGAGESQFAVTLGERLAINVYDRELLEQEAAGLGLSETEMEKIDEQPAGIFQRFHPGSIYQRYAEALAKIMHELAEGGDVLLVGRGGNCFLRDDRRAFHLRLIAAMPVRVRRVMDYRWVRESVARKIIAHSDAQRHGFYEGYFGIDWTNPLEYQMTVNSGRVGPAAVELLALAATRHWSRSQ